MTDNFQYSLVSPMDVQRECAVRAKALRIKLRIPQEELARSIGVSVGTIKRFERTGEIQFHTLLYIALVLGRLEDFQGIFKASDVPSSLFHPEPEGPRMRARKK